jgi:hypothetical protein
VGVGAEGIEIAMKIIYRTILLALLIGLAILISMDQPPKKPQNYKAGGDEQVLSKEFLVFSRDRSWGPCPPGQKCSERISLYRSGRLLKDYVEIRIVSEEEVKKILDIIVKGNFITLSCPQVQIDDMRGSYTFGISEASTNTLEMPTCAALFRPIEELLGI